MAKQRACYDQEREAIAKQLHDDMSQGLTALTLELALLQRRMGNDHPEAQSLREMMDLVTGINKSVRKLTSEVWPKAVAELGFLSAVRSFCHTVQRERRVPVSFGSSHDHFELGPEISRDLFRLLSRIILQLTELRPAALAVSITGDHGKYQVRVEAEGIEGGTSLTAVGEDWKSRAELLDVSFQIVDGSSGIAVVLQLTGARDT